MPPTFTSIQNPVLAGPADQPARNPSQDGTQLQFPQIPPDDTSGTLWDYDETDGGAGYNDYKITHRYETKSGVYATPVAGPPGTPPDIIVVHAPMVTKVARWTVERTGAQPNPPSSDTQNPGDVLLYSSVEPAAPALQGDGYTAVWRVSGTYAYVLAQGLNPTDPYQAGAPPYMTLLTTDTDLAQNLFDNTVLKTPAY